MDVENVSNGGGANSNWQWRGMGKGRRLKSSKFRSSRFKVEGKRNPRPTLSNQGWGTRGGDAFADVGGQGSCLAGVEVNANTGQKSARGKFLGLLICHFVGKEEGFFANLLEGRADGDGVAGEQFAFVLDALFHRDQANPFLAQARGRQPHGRKKLPGGLIKFAHVPHHVHVAHVIAMPGINRPKIRKNWFRHGFVHKSSLRDSQRILFYLNRSRNWRQGGAPPQQKTQG